MTARLRFKSIDNEQAIVVTLIYPDMLRGLTELQRNYFFSSTPKGPLPALWEVGTILLFRLNHWLRHHSLIHRGEDGYGTSGLTIEEDLIVAEESLRNLLNVLKREEKEGKTILLVLSPLSSELAGKESAFTKLAEKLAESYGVPCINMNGRISRQYTENTFTDDRHLGIDAHRLYGETIAEALSAQFATRSNR
jgi:hypothetical protein